MAGFIQIKLGVVLVNFLRACTRRKRMDYLIWSFVFSISLITSSNATTVLYLTDKTLAKNSDLVVIAEVVSEQTLLNEKGYVCTDVEVRIERIIQGETEPNQLTVRRYGGEKDGLSYRIDGSANLTVGDRALLFLSRKEGEMFYVVTGFAQGKLTVIEQANSQDLLLERDVSGLNLIDPMTSAKMSPSDKGSSKQRILLSEITRNIKN